MLSLNRRVCSGTTWLVTRRTAHRMFLLRPDPFVKGTFLYALAYASQEYGVEIHAFQCLSNHYHMVVTDTDGVLPNSLHRFHNLVARLLNLYWERRENLFSSERYSAVELIDEGSIAEKCAYTLANVVAAGLVQRHEDWPGATSSADSFGEQVFQVERPEGPFFARSKLPSEKLTLRLTLPQLHGRRLEIRELVVSLVRKRELEIHEELKQAGREFLGSGAVLKQEPTSSPTTEETIGRRIPEVACKDPERRKMELKILKQFREAYRTARDQFCEGVRNVLFPHGTWLLRVQFGVRCAPVPV